MYKSKSTCFLCYLLSDLSMAFEGAVQPKFEANVPAKFATEKPNIDNMVKLPAQGRSELISSGSFYVAYLCENQIEM